MSELRSGNIFVPSGNESLPYYYYLRASLNYSAYREAISYMERPIGQVGG